MEDEYGILINGAIRAVIRMHGDTSRLLLDCDKAIGKGRPSVFGSTATKELTYSVQAECWMASAVFRYYLAGSNRVEAVTVSFWEGSTPEPMFLLSQIQYRGDNALKDELAGIKGTCDGWDVWRLYFKWGERTPDVVLTYDNVDGGRIESACLIAVPLYSINSIDQVVALNNRLLASATPA
jgi:hypothetical protein